MIGIIGAGERVLPHTSSLIIVFGDVGNIIIYNAVV